MKNKNYKHAVITGASSGIGKTFAEILAKQNVNLVLVARRLKLLEEIAADLRAKYNITVDTLELDLSKSESHAEILRFCESHRYSIDLVINNAGNGAFKSFLDSDPQEIQNTVLLNAFTPIQMMRSFAQHMLAHQKPSSIINVASVASFIEIPNFVAYCATKSFLYKASVILDHELRRTNVNVCCLCPGGTATEFLEKNNQVLVGHASALMSSEKVANLGLAAAQAGRSVCVPGFGNKLQIFAIRFFPLQWRMPIVQKIMGLVVQAKKS